jgi:hypothetical protein
MKNAAFGWAGVFAALPVAVIGSRRRAFHFGA